MIGRVRLYLFIFDVSWKSSKTRLKRTYVFIYIYIILYSGEREKDIITSSKNNLFWLLFEFLII